MDAYFFFSENLGREDRKDNKKIYFIAVAFSLSFLSNKHVDAVSQFPKSAFKKLFTLIVFL